MSLRIEGRSNGTTGFNCSNVETLKKRAVELYGEDLCSGATINYYLKWDEKKTTFTLGKGPVEGFEAAQVFPLLLVLNNTNRTDAIVLILLKEIIVRRFKLETDVVSRLNDNLGDHFFLYGKNSEGQNIKKIDFEKNLLGDLRTELEMLIKRRSETRLIESDIGQLNQLLNGVDAAVISLGMAKKKDDPNQIGYFKTKKIFSHYANHVRESLHSKGEMTILACVSTGKSEIVKLTSKMPLFKDLLEKLGSLLKGPIMSEITCILGLILANVGAVSGAPFLTLVAVLLALTGIIGIGYLIKGVMSYYV